MTNEYELADSSRASLIYTKEQLLAGLTDGMVDSPHAIYPGTDEQDYYRGLVTEAAPGTVRQVAVSKGEVPPESGAAADADETAPAGATRAEQQEVEA
jgi:NADH-quinone oxidoreductase subunit I